MDRKVPLNETELGQRIKQKRWEAGYTQVELGHLVGVSPQQIQKYESGANRVSATLLHAMAIALGADISELFR